MNTCEELFLSDIVKIEVYKAGEPEFTIPSTVPHLTEFRNVKLPTPVLSIAYTDTTVMARENTISVKQSPKQQGSIVTYIYNVEATIDGGMDNILAVIQPLMTEDHNIVTTNAEGKKSLLYALPNTFSVSADNKIKEMSLKMSLTSLSDFITLT